MTETSSIDPTSITTSAMMLPSFTDLILPENWLRALSMGAAPGVGKLLSPISSAAIGVPRRQWRQREAIPISIKLSCTQVADVVWHARSKFSNWGTCTAILNGNNHGIAWRAAVESFAAGSLRYGRLRDSSVVS